MGYLPKSHPIPDAPCQQRSCWVFLALEGCLSPGAEGRSWLFSVMITPLSANDTEIARHRHGTVCWKFLDCLFMKRHMEETVLYFLIRHTDVCKWVFAAPSASQRKMAVLKKMSRTWILDIVQSLNLTMLKSLNLTWDMQLLVRK